ncbi:phosphoribosylglycinamide formyltransferase [Maritalea porphyrae]|jgi:phosphoribosylglycinamide formyltransferase-1|uniref:phosphoribosylglycinamide formyltransferase n=1 Tax=Maritalea porphyrae TaxID=880732 RepID=UPI0022AEF212|nr:phosphoribosylglycinamide formyltransferase [Maritalea porphyrae]MCZ4272934.1 phosphoribosylglycinamide formyltransferase [Maritalea porphyrae]
MSAKTKVAILISGRGSNMRTLIQAAKQEDYPAEIIGVFSNRADAAGLEFAQSENIQTAVISQKDFDSRESFCEALDAQLEAWGAELLAHAGYMRIHADGFAQKWTGKMLNIHPSLLPSFKGLHPQQQALDAGVKIAGATVHEVTPELDAGPPVLQAAVPVLDSDNAESLSARILKVEHQIYPLALKQFIEKRTNNDAETADQTNLIWPN